MARSFCKEKELAPCQLQGSMEKNQLTMTLSDHVATKHVLFPCCTEEPNMNPPDFKLLRWMLDNARSMQPLLQAMPGTLLKPIQHVRFQKQVLNSMWSHRRNAPDIM